MKTSLVKLALSTGLTRNKFWPCWTDIIGSSFRTLVKHFRRHLSRILVRALLNGCIVDD